MMTWLAADLADTTANWIVAFFHHPPYTKGSHDSDTDVELVEMRENALPILEQGGVDLVLTGHSHSYERSFLIDGHYGVSSTFTAAMKKDAGSGRDRRNRRLREARRRTGCAAKARSTWWRARRARRRPRALNHPAMYVSLRHARLAGARLRRPPPRRAVPRRDRHDARPLHDREVAAARLRQRHPRAGRAVRRRQRRQYRRLPQQLHAAVLRRRLPRHRRAVRRRRPRRRHLRRLRRHVDLHGFVHARHRRLHQRHLQRRRNLRFVRRRLHRRRRHLRQRHLRGRRRRELPDVRRRLQRPPGRQAGRPLLLRCQRRRGQRRLQRVAVRQLHDGARRPPAAATASAAAARTARPAAATAAPHRFAATAPATAPRRAAPAPATAARRPATETSCNDGIDNDCDGLTDCSDTAQCSTSPSCATCCAGGNARAPRPLVLLRQLQGEDRREDLQVAGPWQ